MRKYKLFAVVAFWLVLLSGCDNNFDPKIYGSFTPDKYPTTRDEYISCAMWCYVPFTACWRYRVENLGEQLPLYVCEGGMLRLFDGPSDLMAPLKVTDLSGDWLRFSKSDFTNCVNYTRGSCGQNAVNHFQNVAEVTRMTQLIGLIESAPEAVLDQMTKNNLLGEMRLCRGIHMYYTLHIYGPLPMIVDPGKIDNNDDLFNMKRPSLEEMCGWIKDDLEYAVQYAADKSAASEVGRYNRDYARFCLMKHCLNEGSHMEGYYQRAVDMYNDLRGKYRLFNNGSSNPYADLFTSQNEFNEEIIMALSCTVEGNGEGESGNFNPISKYVIPKDASNNISDNPTLAPAGPGWNHYYNISTYFYDTFEEKDLRKKTIVTSYKANDGSVRTRAEIGSKWNGFILNKFKAEVSGTSQPMDIVLARWADVLLMYAEALTRRDNVVSQEAKDAINEIRKRAGLGELETGKTANPSIFLDAILEERGHELFYEGFRKIDLIRFNVYARQCKLAKGETPTHQYMPIPNFAVIQAASHGCQLSQTYSRPGWSDDLSTAN